MTIKLEPFAVYVADKSISQVERLYNLCVRAGANVYDKCAPHTELGWVFLSRAGISKCDYFGVDVDGETLSSNIHNHYNDNSVSYDDAINYLLDVIAEKSPNREISVYGPLGSVESKSSSNKRIKSDGLSSDYYKIYIPKDNIKMSDCGEFYIVQVEDVTEFGCGNDFDKGNLIKSCIRMGKKEGNDDKYELNKMSYSMKKLRRRYLGEPM